MPVPKKARLWPWTTDKNSRYRWKYLFKSNGRQRQSNLVLFKIKIFKLKRDAYTYLPLKLTFLTPGVMFLHNNSLHSILTPWSRVLLEKLTGFQLVKKYAAFYGTRRIIIALPSARHLYLPRPRSIQSMTPITLPPISAGVFQVVSFPQFSPPKPYTNLSSPHTCYMPCSSHYSRFYHPNNNGWGEQLTKLHVM
jgi:hypothetical protein